MDESKLDESVDMDLLANILEQFNSKIENPIIYWTDLNNPLVASARQQDQESGEDVDNYINILEN